MITAPLRRFFFWVIGLSVPFYVLGAFGLRLPGFPILPLGALMAFVPMLAALIVVCRGEGVDGAKALLKSAGDLRPPTMPSAAICATRRYVLAHC
ncbi:MAG: hypothetical protein ABI852_01575 [Gemmatimonadaceae bacterium]